MGETPATSGKRSSSGTSACQLATDRRRWARGWVSVSAAVPGKTGAAGMTRSSGARRVMCAWAPSVLARVFDCKPLISGLQSNTLAKTLGAQAHITLRAPDDLVIPAAPVLPGTAALTETQPPAQRLRSVANWQGPPAPP